MFQWVSSEGGRLMTEGICRSCGSTSDLLPVQVRRGPPYQGFEYEDSSLRRCANNECWTIREGTAEDRMAFIRNQYDYKYFGDYELSPEQLEAVYQALYLAEKAVAA
jgi:hypothetical protein